MQRDLVQQAMAGDHEAFSELTRLTTSKLYAVARLILRDDQRAQDAVQEAFVAAWRQLQALRDPDRFDAWMRRLLVRACYREARKEQRRRTMEGRVRPLATVSPDPGIGVSDADELARMFMRLSPQQRALIVLHFYLGLPIRETSEILGVPVGTVKSRLVRTLQQMRATADAEARLPLVAERPI